MSRSPESILDQLLSRGSEGEILELKNRKNLSDKEMGQYFSALSNEANLQDVESAWMIFGVDDKTHELVNSEYKHSAQSINALKHFIADNSTDRMTYRNVYELSIGRKRILMFEIPAARPGVPTAFCNAYYGRNGESLVILSTEKYERILRQTRPDWSATVIEDATIDWLDPAAILKARENFKRINPRNAEESDSWDDVTFLNKLCILREGKVTNAAMILLGREDKALSVPDTNLHIRWICKDSNGDIIDGKIFGLPFILTAEEVCSRIRNPTYEFLRKGTVVPNRMETYEPYVIREALSNCIAHQDYSKLEYITVVDCEKSCLIFVNAGSFIPESVEEVIRNNRPSNYYRNPFLTNAMVNLGMVDQMGGGIRRMFNFQKNRMFPMPDYKFDKGEVELTLTGHIIDRNFANALLEFPSLSLEDVISLDKVQKGKEIPLEDIDILRNRGLIDIVGGHPVISTIVAKKIDDKSIRVQSVLDHGLGNEYYMDMIVKLISDLGSVSRAEINILLMDKLPDALSRNQKYNKITNLIRVLSKDGRIVASGPNGHKIYSLPATVNQNQ